VKLLKAFASKMYTSAIVGAVWYGGQRIDWPNAALLAAEIAAIALFAVLAHFFVYWTRNLGDGLPWVEFTCRAALWLLLVAAVSLWMVAEPKVGITGGVLLLYMAGDTWREQLGRAFRRLRFEGVALRRDDPARRPVMVRQVAPPQ
jgi:hypothetical protein